MLTKDGKYKVYKNSECQFAYRNSIFATTGDFITKVTFHLSENNDTNKYLQKHLKKRISSQPIDKKNSGCIFRNPQYGKPAGELIDGCGLKGCRIGGAVVSRKHANFINNEGNATYRDILGLIKIIQKRVLELTGVNLEYEIRII